MIFSLISQTHFGAAAPVRCKCNCTCTSRRNALRVSSNLLILIQPAPQIHLHFQQKEIIRLCLRLSRGCCGRAHRPPICAGLGFISIASRFQPRRTRSKNRFFFSILCCRVAAAIGDTEVEREEGNQTRDRVPLRPS